MKSLLVLLLAVVGVALATKCEEERDAANGQGVGAFIPTCDEDGSYAEMQCHGSTAYCYCARKNGEKINEPARFKYESCKCVRHQDDVKNTGLIGAYIPQCQENGKYTSKQCWGSTGTCWCADELTGEKLSDTNC